MAKNFTFPTETESRFKVADLVNVTWDVLAPLVSLYESCGNNNRALEEQTSNNYSYVWIATRTDYIERGCNFKLQPFTAEGESYGDNITSVTFGVSKRYTDDPPPVSYNFIDASPSTHASPTKVMSTSVPPSTGPETISPSLPETNSTASNALSRTGKIGIGLGVPLGVLLVAVAFGTLILCQRKIRHKDNKELSVTNQPHDELAPLPLIGHKDIRHTRLSQTETVASFSQLSSDNEGSGGTERRLSELMSTERVEMG